MSVSNWLTHESEYFWAAKNKWNPSLIHIFADKKNSGHPNPELLQYLIISNSTSSPILIIRVKHPGLKYEMRIIHIPWASWNPWLSRRRERRWRPVRPITDFEVNWTKSEESCSLQLFCPKWTQGGCCLRDQAAYPRVIGVPIMWHGVKQSFMASPFT